MADETIEKQAKAMGWVPEDEFRGNPELWKDAEVFVKDGYEVLPILRERTKNMADKMDEVTKKLAKTESLLVTLTDHHKKTEELAYQRAMADFKVKQREAIENQDVDAFDKIDQQIEKLEKPNIDKPDQNLDPGFIEWKSENIWYDNNAEMAVYADSVASFVERTNPNLKGKPFFDKVSEEVKARYPDKFKNPNRAKPDVVEGATGDNNVGSTKPKKKLYSDMPREAKEICDELVRGGAMKKEDYIKEYWELIDSGLS